MAHRLDNCLPARCTSQDSTPNSLPSTANQALIASLKTRPKCSKASELNVSTHTFFNNIGKWERDITNCFSTFNAINKESFVFVIDRWILDKFPSRPRKIAINTPINTTDISCIFPRLSRKSSDWLFCSISKNVVLYSASCVFNTIFFFVQNKVRCIYVWSDFL